MNWKRTSPCPKAVDAWWKGRGGKKAKYIKLKDRRVIAYRKDADTMAVLFRCLHKDERKISDTAIRLSNEAIDALQVLKKYTLTRRLGNERMFKRKRLRRQGEPWVKSEKGNYICSKVFYKTQKILYRV